MHFRKPELIPLLFIIAATLVLGGLGVWQVERLQWKNAMLADIARAQEEPALGSLPQDTAGLEYRNVALTGSFVYDKTLHLIGRPQDVTEQGFFLVTPFRLEDDGRIILVNRGFSPLGKETTPEGLVTVRGIVRPERPKRTFSPDNRPDKNIWFYEDVPAMSAATGLELTPVVIEAVGPREKNVYPIPNDGKISLRNDHLGYAITWFCLMIIGLVMFGFYHREPKRP